MGIDYNEKEPFINKDRTTINFGAIDKIRETYDEELIRVLLTKIKRKKDGVIEETGATKLDNFFNAFLEANQT